MTSSLVFPIAGENFFLPAVVVVSFLREFVECWIFVNVEFVNNEFVNVVFVLAVGGLEVEFLFPWFNFIYRALLCF